jgi:hypothetical protein
MGALVLSLMFLQVSPHTPDDLARGAQDKAYQDSLRAQYMAICGARDCRNSERNLRQQFERDLLKQFPGLAFQMELQDRLKQHFDRPPVREMLRSDYAQSI